MPASNLPQSFKHAATPASVLDQLDNHRAPTALELAIRKGDLAEVKLWVEKRGVDINNIESSCNRSYLSLAMMFWKEEIAHYLLMKGADAMKLDYIGDLPPIMYAIEHDMPKLATTLVTSGVDVNAIDRRKHDTALHLSVKKGFDDVARKLLRNGADVNLKNVVGATPLHIAAHLNKEEITDDLLRAGANPNISVLDGFTPLHYAALKDNPVMMESLLAAGADVNATHPVYGTARDMALEKIRARGPANQNAPKAPKP